MRGVLITSTVAALLALGAGGAEGAVRYAEPGGDGPAATCPRGNPCDIQVAVEDPSVVTGDEVVLAPGTYDLANDELLVDDAIELHGPERPGQARPTIFSADPPAATLSVSTAEPEIHHLRVVSNQSRAIVMGTGHLHDVTGQTANGPEALFASFDPLIERVVMSNGTGWGCVPPRSPGLLRDSVCFTAGDGGAKAVGTTGPVNTGVGTFTYRLRNVTAIATGDGGFGLFAQSFGGQEQLVVDARNVIADAPNGVLADVRAETIDPGAEGRATITLAHSNYDTATDTGQGALVTAPGTGTNQTDQYELTDPANGIYRQLPTSPTVNAGGSAGLLGQMDFERQPRRQGPAPDIGADELDTGGLTLRAKARKRQPAAGLKVKLACPFEDCEARVTGKIKAGGRGFALKLVRRALVAPEPALVRLRPKRSRVLRRALEGHGGKARIRISADDAQGASAKKRLRVEVSR